MHFTETFASANKGDLLDNKQTLFQFLPCCQAKIIKSTLWETSGLLGTMIDCFKHGNDLSIICAYAYYNHSISALMENFATRDSQKTLHVFQNSFYNHSFPYHWITKPAIVICPVVHTLHVLALHGLEFYICSLQLPFTSNYMVYSLMVELLWLCNISTSIFSGPTLIINSASNSLSWQVDIVP